MKCNKCKNEALDGGSLCSSCLAKKTLRRKQRKESGQCAYCDLPAFSGSNLCLAHKEKRATRDKERLERRKVEKQCVTCGKTLTDESTLTCSGCLAQRISNFDKRNNVGLCRTCNNDKLSDSTYCQKCKDYYYDHSRAFRTKVLNQYGHACACCGESTYEFLTIDHVHNDGHLDRKQGFRGPKLLRKIVAENYPDHYQILCYNCNGAKSTCPNGCPHLKKKIMEELTMLNIQTAFNEMTVEQIRLILWRTKISTLENFRLLEAIPIDPMHLRYNIHLTPRNCAGIEYDNLWVGYNPFTERKDYGWGAHCLPEDATDAAIVAQFDFLEKERSELAEHMFFPAFRSNAIFQNWRDNYGVTYVTVDFAEFEYYKLMEDMYVEKYVKPLWNNRPV